MLVCCPMADRIALINDLVAFGYEVQVNFSPVIADASGTGENRHDCSLTKAPCWAQGEPTRRELLQLIRGLPRRQQQSSLAGDGNETIRRNAAHQSSIGLLLLCE